MNHGDGIVNRSKIQVVDQAGRIQPPRNESCAEQRAQLRSKQEILARGTVVERLDAHRIAAQQQTRSLGIPDREGKHSAQLAETLLAPAAISLQQHFGIGLADKAHAFALQSASGVRGNCRFRRCRRSSCRFQDPAWADGPAARDRESPAAGCPVRFRGAACCWPE